MQEIKQNDQMEVQMKSKILQSKRMKSIEEVLEEVEVLIDAHFFNEFWLTK